MKFERTTCGCDQCAVGCRTMPGTLAVGDLEEIAKHQGADPNDWDWLTENFQSSDGLRILRVSTSGPTEGDIEEIRIPTIVPKLVSQSDGSDAACIFLGADGLCQVHQVAPYGCSHYDAHMGGAEADDRTRGMVDDLIMDPKYRATSVVLAEAGCVAAPLVERKANYRDAEKKVLRNT